MAWAVCDGPPATPLDLDLVPCAHFTPWLAEPENLEVLSETLGIDLELEAQEKDVGPFRADILCKNTAEKDS